VILDEPTAALSVSEQRKVLSLTRRRQLASQGVAVIYITHNILDAMAVADRLVILHRGREAAEVATKDTNERGCLFNHGQGRPRELSHPAHAGACGKDRLRRTAEIDPEVAHKVFEQYNSGVRLR
jgi:ABC-type sugar transport system ATPase subunit